MVVGSPDFSRAIVNRTWAQILGRGFTWPIDDMGPHNQPSHPELLNYLADQFAAMPAPQRTDPDDAADHEASAEE